MLEGRAQHHARILVERVLGAVAVMHVEVEDRDALEAVRLDRVHRADRHVVEDAEAHGRDRAWRDGPGGRTAQNAFFASPDITRSVAVTTAPAACNAAESDFVFIERVGIEVRVAALRRRIEDRSPRDRARCTRSSCSRVASGASRIDERRREPRSLECREDRLQALRATPDVRSPSRAGRNRDG